MIKNIEIIKYNNGFLEKTFDNVAEESKINIFVNGSHYISLLCSNSELTELCTGFLFSEGVISSFKDIKNIEVSCNNNIFISLDESINFFPEKHRIIVETIVSFARRIGIKTVAEFVADKQILEIIKEIGVSCAQGYYIGKPEKL